MELSRRIEIIQQHITAIKGDIDQPQGECTSALNAVIEICNNAKSDLTEARDVEIARRRENR